MHRNFGICPHCTAKGLPGKVWKLNEKTPSVTLSDGKSFHLILFSGPDSIPAPSGGIFGNRLAAQFSYMHDRLGTEARRIAVVLTRPGESLESVKNHLEAAADKLAELLESGKPLAAEYGFDGERLSVLNAYKSKLRPLCPVAIKVEQNEIHAPDHDTFGIVSCDSCGDEFHIGPHRFHGSRTTPQETAKQLQTLLAEDHRTGRPHSNAYELSD